MLLGKRSVVLGRFRMSVARVPAVFRQARRFIRLSLSVTKFGGCLTSQFASLGGRIRLDHCIRARADRVGLQSWLKIILQYEGLKVQLGGESMRVGSSSVLTRRFGVCGGETVLRSK